MPQRRLSPDERALWQRVIASIQPFAPTSAGPPIEPFVPMAMPAMPSPGRKPTLTHSAKPIGPGTTLDARWDRQLARGAVTPDSSIDLHGHTLSSAYALLDVALDRSIRRGDRLLLLVTGKPPRPDSERPHTRGAIRAAIADWLAGSPHARDIAAVRAAHPRHGGQGALYVVLRRRRVDRPR